MNAKDGGNRPVITIKHKGKVSYAREVIINGPSKIVHNGSQLSCGARVWIETDSDIQLIEEMTFKDARNIEH